jgi:hypothetical protein
VASSRQAAALDKQRKHIEASISSAEKQARQVSARGKATIREKSIMHIYLPFMPFRHIKICNSSAEKQACQVIKGVSLSFIDIAVGFSLLAQKV